MQERQERQREEQIVSHVIEGEQIRQTALSYIDIERQKLVSKRQQQLSLRSELDQLVKARRQHQLEKER
jgi:hypothetical protein